MVEKEKKLKLILLSHSFLYMVDDGAREKTHSVITLFSVFCLWWSKGKSSFCCNIVSCMLSMMEQKKKLILLQHYFLYVVYDGATEKTHSVITLIFVCCLWWRKRKKLIFLKNYIFLCSLWWRRTKNSFCYNIIFCMLSMMEQLKKLILL